MQRGDALQSDCSSCKRLLFHGLTTRRKTKKRTTAPLKYKRITQPLICTLPGGVLLATVPMGVSFFTQLFVDTDLGRGSDAIQTYIGFSFDLRHLFGSKKTTTNSDQTSPGQ